jgi:hypothetical protein
MSLKQGISFAILAGAVLVAYRDPGLPAPQPESAGKDVFSARRALVHVAAIAQEPHPAGTEANRAARAYIAGEISKLGLTPVEQPATAVRLNRGNMFGARVTNIMTRIAGTANTKAVLLVGHYDSVANGPGAADDGYSVGLLLETLRALRASPPLQNDVIALVTDAEESGLMGAAAFVAENPWAKDAGVVVNFEARGTKGVPVMFETSDENGRLIAEYAKAVPHPNASSLTYEIYKMLPNDTDLTVFRKGGYPGLNFAFIENFLFYHTPYDNMAHLDAGTVQHQGDSALALARHFGAIDLREMRAPNRVYFTLPMLGLFTYPQSWVWPLTAIGLLATAYALAMAFRAKILKTGGLLIALVLFPVAAVGAGALARLAWSAAARVKPEYTSFPQGDVYNHGWYIAAFAALSVAMVALAMAWRGVASISAAALIWTAALAIAISAKAPGASYVQIWPLLFSAVALAVYARGKARPSVAGAGLIVLLSAVSILVIVPLIPQLFTALGMQASAPATVVAALLAGLAGPALAILAADRWRWLAGAGMVIFAASLAGGIATSNFDREHPRQNSVFYALDGDSGKAVWASSDAVPDEWTSQFLGNDPKRAANPVLLRGSRTLLQADAQAVPMEAPVVSVTSDTEQNGERRVRAKIVSPRHAGVVTIFVSSDAPVGSVETEGHPLRPENAPKEFVIHFEGFPAEGIEVSFGLAAGHKVNLRVVDQSSGLPQAPGMTVRPRAEWMMRGLSFPYGESTVVSKAFSL